MTPLPLTPSQTVGPFFAYGLTARQYGYDYTSLADGYVAGPALQQGEPIQITGRIFDGNGDPVSDAMVELWQADEAGQYRAGPVEYPNPPDAFTGFGRLGTGTTTDYHVAFITRKPGCTGTGDAPHSNVILFMRGSLRTLYTRLYFSDEPDANGQDALLNTIPADRRPTLIAQKVGNGQYTFDIHLQGLNETVFFDV